MICEDSYSKVYSNDGRIYVDGRDSRSITCTLAPVQPCNHRIKVEYYGCNNYNPTIYSGYFSVSNRHPCNAQYLDNYECLGNSVRQQYQDSYCSVTWKTIEVCGNGCSNGKCVSAATTTTNPATTTTSTIYYQPSGPAGTYTGWFASPVLFTWNDLIIALLIIALLIVLILIILLLLKGRGGCGRGLFRRRCGAESF